MKWSKTKKIGFSSILLICAFLFGVFFAAMPSRKTVSFNADVRPILNKHCLSCHGGVKKASGLSFLFREEAFAPTKSGEKAIIPGDPMHSEMIIRVKHEDPDLRMPPEGSPLSPKEIKVLSQWIDQGAKWGVHWAYTPPKRVTPPNLKPTNRFRPQNPIDHFILEKILENDLEPSPKADKTTLLRRVSLDLIGLPPSQEQILSFSRDTTSNAFEKQVDQLLASPHFGERWTSTWMDLARYGDSQGYQKDHYRSIWRYRDWLIDAFNEDLPFDQFTILQLAGDLFPQPTENELLATAFHRNTMSNDEGGTDDEEFRIAAVIDRVNTTWEVWQATTISCVQCHSHPYDPFRHEEYYQLFAFFNNTQDADRTDDQPNLLTYSVADKAFINRLAHTYGLQENALQTLESDKLDSIRIRLLEKVPSVLHDSLNQLEMVKTPIMLEMQKGEERITQIFERGNWLVRGDTVGPKVPGSLPALPSVDIANRMDFAEWLVSPDNPLTARVFVNRIWAELFGRGIVETIEDFGTQGNPPSHPELLDWLALDFSQNQQWHLKKLLKRIVLSESYQQSSKATNDHLKKDPQNIWLARAPRLRLTAEQIRDQALAVSGLLSKKMYGPSVMPPQPEGVWQVIRNLLQWKESKGEDRYRRALYTFWRKSSPYPSFMTFDSPGREVCVSRRIRTNTPLQALVTLNDTVYVEVARAIATKMLSNDSIQVAAKLAAGYEKLNFRYPTDSNLEVLVRNYEESYCYYQDHPDEAKQLALDTSDQAIELAAFTVVANIMLNLDEFIVRE